MLKLIRVALFVVVLGALLFTSAGRWNVPGFWAYLLVGLLAVAPGAFAIQDPGLGRERRRPGPGGIDGGLRRFAAPLLVVHFIVAGLDVGRYGWSTPPAVALQVAALMGCGAGLALVVWSMASNTFFSPVVRLQTERGHHVITAGPYRVVRHPGYLGMAAAFCLSGIALGSWWSMLPALAYVGLVLRRTVIEDRFLLEKLVGYHDYAGTVRWRLVPGIWALMIGVLVTVGAASLVRAQQAQAPRALGAALADPRVQKALEIVDARRDAIARQLAALGAIVSPSGHEHDRARTVAARMREIGLQRVSMDEAPNAVGIIPGRSGRALVFVSTLDDLATVADHQKAAGQPPRVEGDKVIGPGTNTSATTAAMLAAAEALVTAGVRPEHDLVFAAVAQEETGLVGMTKLYGEYKDRAVGFVDILGDGRSISYGAIGIHWWKVVAHGPAGHTLSGGLPNVNQGIGRAVDRILMLPQPQQRADARTVINIAVLSSGAVFNHKPDTGWFSLDIRSLNGAVLDGIETDVRRILDQVTMDTTITFAMEPSQMTPGGQIPGARDSALVRTAEAISKHLGLEPTLGDGGSSNMNVAIGGGTLAIGLGGNRGGERGTPAEWADIPAMIRSAKHIVLLAATIGTS